MYLVAGAEIAYTLSSRRTGGGPSLPPARRFGTVRRTRPRARQDGWGTRLDVEGLERRAVRRHAHVVPEELAARLGRWRSCRTSCGVTRVRRPAARARARRRAAREPQVRGRDSARRVVAEVVVADSQRPRRVHRDRRDERIDARRRRGVADHDRSRPGRRRRPSTPRTGCRPRVGSLGAHPPRPCTHSSLACEVDEPAAADGLCVSGSCAPPYVQLYGRTIIGFFSQCAPIGRAQRRDAPARSTLPGRVSVRQEPVEQRGRCRPDDAPDRARERRVDEDLLRLLPVRAGVRRSGEERLRLVGLRGIRPWSDACVLRPGDEVIPGRVHVARARRIGRDRLLVEPVRGVLVTVIGALQDSPRLGRSTSTRGSRCGSGSGCRGSSARSRKGRRSARTTPTDPMPGGTRRPSTR